MKSNRTKTRTAAHDKGQRGFTLIETSISMVVMMIAGLAVSSLFVFSMQNNVGGGERALAMAVAQQRLEQLRSVSYEDATLDVGSTTSTIRSGGRDYEVVTTIANETNDDGTPKRLKRLTITVTPAAARPGWTRTSVVLVSLRSTLASGNYAVSN